MIQGQDYNLTLVSKHVQSSDAIKKYLIDKLLKVEKMIPQLIDIHAKFEVQKLDNTVLLTMKFSHFLVTAHATTTDMYASIDLAVDRLVSKVRKWKSKIQEHHHIKLNAVDIPVTIFEKNQEEIDAINDQIEEENVKRTETIFTDPKVVKSKLRKLKVLTLKEALFKMDLSDDNFLVYRSEEDQKLKVLYRRRDKSYGLLQPE